MLICRRGVGSKSFYMMGIFYFCVFFFFQAEDGIRDADVTGVQTCALPISNINEGAGSYGFSDFVVHNLKAGVQVYALEGNDDVNYINFNLHHVDETLFVNRSEERRVGKECRCRWSADHRKKEICR